VGGTPGDLYVKVHVKADPRFRKEGADLVMPHSIKLTDALLGASHKVETLDGELTVKIPQGVTFGERLRVKGKGVPQRGGKRGDLFIQININVPTKLSKKAHQTLEVLREEGL
jgi:DnaJ-class molecular chaperone